MNTVLVTGCSSDFDRETAAHFLAEGCNVVATMRYSVTSTLPASGRLRVLPLDVTDADSIAAATSEAGVIDVLVNDAGIGWLDAVEGTSRHCARSLKPPLYNGRDDAGGATRHARSEGGCDRQRQL